MIDDFDWECIKKQEFAYLNTLDLRYYIKKHSDLYDIMTSIEEAFEDQYVKLSSENNDMIFDACLFNNISSDEFLEYLCKRYGATYQEKTRYIVNSDNIEDTYSCDDCKYYFKEFDGGGCFKRNNCNQTCLDFVHYSK